LAVEQKERNKQKKKKKKVAVNRVELKLAIIVFAPSLTRCDIFDMYATRLVIPTPSIHNAPLIQ
jgi:hypothetical protein